MYLNLKQHSYVVRPDSDGGGIQVSLKKNQPDWWPRLMYQQQKLSWLKVIQIQINLVRFQIKGINLQF